MAPFVTNYAEIQHDEIEALRSIYMDDFVEEETKTGAWNRSTDRAFKIRLRSTITEAQQGSKMTLTVSFPPTYPKTLPRLSLDSSSDLRQKIKSEAESILKMKSKTLIGSEMIFEIATALQEVLDNEGGIDSKDVPTLDEERAVRERAARASAFQAEEEKRQQALKQQAEEEKTLQDLVKQRKIALARRAVKSTTELSLTNDEADVPGVVAFERPSSSIKMPSGRVGAISTVHQRVTYRCGPVCLVSTVQPFRDIDGEESSSKPPFLVLKECRVSTSIGNEPSMKRAIQNLESKLDLHTSLVPHQSIVKPLNYQIQKYSDSEKPTAWAVTILMELATRHSLRDTLKIVDNLDTKAVRAWSIQLIEGLQHYHRHGLAHTSLHSSNVLLEESDMEQGERKTTIAKLADGGFERDLHLLKNGKVPEMVPVPWTAPEIVNQTETPLPATDIWDFGICILQMAFGLAVTMQHQSPFALLESLKLTISLRALLSQVFQIEPRKRPSAWDLLHFEFFRNDDALLDDQDPDVIMTGSEFSPKTVELQRFHPRRDSYTAPPSRYAKEFVEEGRLGRGGFGEVFRARNKVDGQPYAIKKIKASSKSALDPVLSEATVLSRLNHPNVVRYFASWIDDGIMTQDPGDSEASEDDMTSSVTSDGRRPALPASSRGLDFISSSNADVVFAYNDDGEESSDEEEDEDYSRRSDEKASSLLETNGHTKSHLADADPKAWTVLYIQMEYCKQETLRDLVNTGLQANAHECWRLFRQIVQGLSHIHGLSIVHRDLKPENIFIDSGGDVRIGDFGLARPGDYRTSASSTKPTREVFGSFTKNIGTASYIAPEVRSAGNGKYNEKADMFSLGVILLEMSIPFATGMERAQTLAKLQKEDHTLPPALDVPEKATQGRIFLSLVQNKPSMRPSSADLLNSGEIPVQDEDESFRKARRLLADQNSHFRSGFISSLFPKPQMTSEYPILVGTTPSDPMQAITLLEDVRAMSRSLPNDLELQAKVKSHLTAIFHHHGAVERTDSPALFPLHQSYPSEDVVQFLSPTGKVMQLPYDLILPNAISLAGRSRPEPKTFVFDNVYRVDHLKDQPKIFGEANFDIVSEKSTNLALREAEVIKIVDEILDTFPNLSSVQMCYHINHSYLLNAILRFCNIDASRWLAAKETISKLHTGEWTWTKVRHELRGPSIAIPATSLDELELFDFRDTWDDAVPRLRSILKDAFNLEATFAHMQAVTLYLARLNIKRKVYISPLSSYNEKFYNGNILFQCIYDQKRRSVLAAGGRYDQLIRQHQPITSRRTHVHAVGFQLAWTSLSANLASYLEKVAKSKNKKRADPLHTSAWKTRRCDVLVDSFDQELLDTVGVDILNELWSNNISAELAERDIEVNGENVYTKTDERVDDHNWVILVKAEDLMKIKNTSRKDETEVRVSELAVHLRTEVRDRDRQEGRAPKASLLRHSSQQDSAAPDKDREVDIKVLSSQNKGKKVNRKTIVEEAQAHKRAYLQACSDSPIVAIETKDEIFEGIIETRLSDPDSWKEFIQGAPPGERQYLGQLQNMLKNMQKDATPSNSNAIIYNFRTKACIAYHLGKAP